MLTYQNALFDPQRLSALQTTLVGGARGLLSKLISSPRLLALLASLVAVSLLRKLTRRKLVLEGKVCLVTGGGGGIGRLLCRRFADLGCKVVIWDIDKTTADNVAKEINAKHGPNVATAYKVDLCNREDVHQISNMVMHDVGFVEILVNNAGIVTGTPLLEASDTQIQRTFEVNAISHFWTIRNFLPEMLSRDQGVIVTIASSAGLFGVPKLVDYCSSKFAAVGLHEALTMELARIHSRVRTTVVCPYYINTGMFTGAASSCWGLLRMLDQDYVADEVVRAVQYNQQVVLLPRILALAVVMKSLLPARLSAWLFMVSGAASSMDHFQGHKK